MTRSFSFALLASRKSELLCAALLGVMAINLVTQVARKSITNDETVLIPAAYYHLVAGEPHLVYEHPPLCKILAGIPLLFIQPHEIRAEQLEPGKPKSEQAWAYQMTFWTDNRDKFESISFWTRIPMIVFTLSFGVLLFVFTRDLFGATAAVFAVALFTLEPLMLAHGRVVQTDVPAAFGYVLLFHTMYRYATAPTLRRAAWIGAATGVALLAKFSMLLAGPVLLVFFAMRLWRSQARGTVVVHMLAIVVSGVLVINAAYFFKHRDLRPGEIVTLQTGFAGVADVLVPVTKGLSHVLPAEFVIGILWQVTHSAEGHTAGLLGMYSKTGWWYYFPVAFALKATLPFLLLSLGATVWGVWRVIAHRDRRLLWILLPLVAYSAFVLFTGINIGVRYLAPAYAFLFIFGGAGLAALIRLPNFSPAGPALTALIVACCAIIAIRAYPDYTPYMNPLASGRPDWWYLSDSNIEWGDDVKGLADYLHARGETAVRAALLGGFVTLQFYNIGYVDALSDTPLPETRYVALGASFLNGSTVTESPGRTEEQRVNRFDAFRHRTPEAIIGGSIYLYRMHD